MFRLERHFADEMIAHVREEVPLEACGVLGGPPGGPVEKLYRARNARQSPVEYEVDAQDLIDILQDIWDRGWDQPLAIYHSHPAGPAVPSATDMARAGWPDSLYIIISLANPTRPSLRGFHIVEGEVEEEPVEVC